VSVSGGSGAGGSPPAAGGSSGGGGTGGSGGTGASGSACDIDACGGDPEGSWSIGSVCGVFIESVFDDPACTGSSTSSVQMAGTYTFAEGNVTWDVTSTTSSTIAIGDACARAIAGIDAATFCPSFETGLVDSGGLSSVVCHVDGLCLCDLVSTEAVRADSDTYEIAGAQLIDSAGNVMPFCVDGDTFLLQLSSGSTTVTLTLERE
jgi:hypothetical protein